mmetsp:Transcript_36756/g.60527  ORF Transcript_36756/g.60527 Transcript_36756/m.60527 type:complete len:730 (-) Transcript_36756:43-2232(-)
MATAAATNLFDLKGKVRRNPAAYKNDVLRQINHWDSILSLMKISNKPNTTRQRTKDLQELIDFLCAVVDRYPSEAKCVLQFPSNLLNLLDEHHETLNTAIKKCIIKNLVFLQLKNLIDTTKLLSLYFRLLSLHEKVLRFEIYSSIVKIITAINKRSKNETVNRSIQNYMFNMLRDENETTVKKSLSILIEMYRRSIWKNAKIVNIIADLCLYHKSSAILRQALHFMLGHKSSLYRHFKEDELKKMEKKKLKSQVKDLKFNARRRRKRMLEIAQIQQRVDDQRDEAEELIDGDGAKIDLSAIRSLYDAQFFTEKLFKRLTANKYLWDIRLLMMNLISRCVSTHQLFLFPFYSYLLKYLRVSQKNITQILAFTAQSIHRLVPPEIIQPVIAHIANEFVGQFSGYEAIAVGINGIRLICQRQPIAIHRELLHDLTEYSKYKKDRGVQMAARGLVHLYRVENPDLLLKKDRGKYHAKDVDVLQYGEERVIKDLPGAHLFEQEEEILNTKVYVTKEEAAFLGITAHAEGEKAGDEDGDEEDVSDGDDEDDGSAMDEDEEDEVYSDNDDADVEYHVVENDAARKAKKRKPLLVRRILSDKDLERLKELRVNNLMKIWNRERDEVGLIEDKESEDEIDADQEVESSTVLAKRRKEQRKEEAKNNGNNQKSWDEVAKQKGGTSTNKEKKRQKPFKMSKYGMQCMKKTKRSIKLRKMIMGTHKKRLKTEGKRANRRRR